MTADKALEILAWVKDRRDYRRACGLRRPADDAHHHIQSPPPPGYGGEKERLS